MKKLMSVMMILVLMAMMFTGCSGSATADTTAAETSAAESTATETETQAVADKLQQIKDSGKLVLGTSADYPPFEFHLEVDGKDTIVGFDIDIANKIAAAIGVELEIVDMKFEGLLPALTAGKIDLIVSGMTPTDERKQSVDFSVVYYDARQTMLVASDSKDVLNTIEAFAGKVIGAQKGSIQETLAATTFTASEVKAIDKIPNLMMELKTGKVDGLVLAEPVAKQYAAANPDLAVNGLDLGSEGGSAVAVQKDSGAFLDLINQTIEEMISSGEMDQVIADAMLLSEGE
ncbi:MAG: transporter substrate-binding domain-containing protein [Firmicutes bacterium]|nr:transporter substrate-binding domain-containing protein [Bacillota bacterium]